MTGFAEAARIAPNKQGASPCRRSIYAPKPNSSRQLWLDRCGSADLVKQNQLDPPIFERCAELRMGSGPTSPRTFLQPWRPFRQSPRRDERGAPAMASSPALRELCRLHGLPISQPSCIPSDRVPLDRAAIEKMLIALDSFRHRESCPCSHPPPGTAGFETKRARPSPIMQVRVTQTPALRERVKHNLWRAAFSVQRQES